MPDMQKNVTPSRHKGCPNYSPEFKQQLVAASCEPGIPSEAVGRAKPVLQQRLGGNRQQHRGERATGCCPGPEKLAVRWFRCGRGAGSSAVLADRHLPAEWSGTGDVAALCAGSYPGLVGKPAARAAAMES